MNIKRKRTIPTYTLQNIETNEEKEIFFTSYSKLEEYLLEFPNQRTIIRSAPAIVGGVGGLKVSDGFNDLLKGIKRGSGQNNTINTK